MFAQNYRLGFFPTASQSKRFSFRKVVDLETIVFIPGLGIMIVQTKLMWTLLRFQTRVYPFILNWYLPLVSQSTAFNIWKITISRSFDFGECTRVVLDQNCQKLPLFFQIHRYSNIKVFNSTSFTSPLMCQSTFFHLRKNTGFETLHRKYSTS